ncbi:AraC family transcriptional regulator [Hyphomicrobium sp.]|jgi:AraC-like DNA-binding protein|uniref:AraC family transcriptional regulator n=1 Tax=Hyphomicrobium sp. TaxID=82 RepID=UPI0035612AD7
MHSSGVIATSIIDGVVSMIDSRGMDPGTISARVGIADDGLFGRSSFLPLSTFTTLLEMAAYQTNDPVLGIKLGKNFNFRSLGPTPDLVSSARTIGEGVAKFAEYFPTMQSNTHCTLETNGGIARLSYSIVDRTVTHRIQDANFSEAVFYSVLQASLGEDWQPLCLEFEHSAGSNLASYTTHFDCPLHFGARHNAILFPASDLDRSVRSFDLSLHQRLDRELSECLRSNKLGLDLTNSVKAWISANLCRSTSIDICDAASDFGMSVRSFQRKLSDASLSYADLRNAVRTEIAKAMLAFTDRAIPEIAADLGYSETSAFARSFKSFTGATPAKFRVHAVRDKEREKTSEFFTGVTLTSH